MLQHIPLIVKFVYMNLLQPYILKLLQTNDCVVIPAFGAFIAREVPAYYDEESQSFIAPGRELSFNVLLTEDDGLLINYVANYKKLNYVGAKQFVKDQVILAQKNLKVKGEIQIEGIGGLINDSHHHLIFKSSVKRLEQLSLFGLHSTFTFTEISVKSVEMENNKEEAPKTKLMYRIAAGAIAAVVITAIIFLFPDNKGKHVQTAGINVADAVEMVDSFTSTNNDKLQESKEDLAENNVNVASKEAKEEVVAEDSNTKEVKETTKILLEEEKAFNSNPARYYHVIIGSVASNKMAEKIANKIVVYDGIYASVLDCGERFRIVNKTFTNRKRAIAYCNAFKEENPKFMDAWVYVEQNR